MSNSKFTASLLNQLEEIAKALGISDEDAECSNGNAEILIAIEAMKNSLTIYQDGYTNARNQIKMLQEYIGTIAREKPLGIIVDRDGEHFALWRDGTPEVGTELFALSSLSETDKEGRSNG